MTEEEKSKDEQTNDNIDIGKEENNLKDKNDEVQNIMENSDSEEVEFLNNPEVENNPNVGEYWRIDSSDETYPYVIIESIEPEEDLIGVKFFKSSSRGTGLYFKNEKLFTICLKDLDKQVAPPKEKHQRKRTFYCFEEGQDVDFFD